MREEGPPMQRGGGGRRKPDAAGSRPGHTFLTAQVWALHSRRLPARRPHPGDSPPPGQENALLGDQGRRAEAREITATPVFIFP